MAPSVEKMAWSVVGRQIGYGPGADGDDDGDGEAGGFQGGAYTGDEDGNNDWWWTPAGMATRYAIVAVLFGGLLVFFVGGYYHAQQRLRKGLPPLAYHRWMVRRQVYPRYPPQQPLYATYQSHEGRAPPANGYVMDPYPPPPPAYNTADGPPPVYQPPPGSSKVMADQNFEARIARSQENSGEGAHVGDSGAVPAPSATARL